MRTLVWMMVALLVSGILGCKKGSSTEFNVQGVTPVQGHLRGDQSVRIVGNDFRTDVGYTVYFGAKKAGNVMVQDAKTLVVMTPAADKAGPVDVWVRSDNGPEYRIREAYRYEDLSGSIVEKLGTPGAQKKGSSNLKY